MVSRVPGLSQVGYSLPPKKKARTQIPSPAPQRTRQNILDHLKDPQIFRSVMEYVPSQQDSTLVRELRAALEKEPLGLDEIRLNGYQRYEPNGSEATGHSRDPQPAVLANFYAQLARQFQRQVFHLAHERHNEEFQALRSEGERHLIKVKQDLLHKTNQQSAQLTCQRYASLLKKQVEQLSRYPHSSGHARSIKASVAHIPWNNPVSPNTLRDILIDTPDQSIAQESCDGPSTESTGYLQDEAASLWDNSSRDALRRAIITDSSATGVLGL